MDVSAMIEASTVGSAMVIGTIDANGEPCAGRVWGIREGDDGRVRLALDAHDHRVLACLGVGAAVAVTTSNVQTLATVQLKGTSEGVEAPNRSDRRVTEHSIETLLAAIDGADRHPRRIVSQFVPGEYVVCRVRCRELYDQTPGPQAGAALDS